MISIHLKNTHWYQKLRNLKRTDVIAFLKKSRLPIFYGIVAGIAVMIVIPIFTYFYFVRDLSSKENIINKKNAGVVLLDRNDKPFFTLFEAHTKEPITFRQISKYTRDAFIAVEDKDFYNHPGFSIRGFARAIRENILNESYAQGGSTISQQLIKNAILSTDKHLLRKYQELVLAIELERRYGKDDILEMYLNSIYFGEGAFGIEDASQRYFSKDTKDLTLAESALLAGVIRAPSALSPISGNFDAAIKRKNLILQLMEEQGYITESEKVTAQKQKIVLNPTEDEINEEAVHFALMVQDMLIKEYGEQTVANSGFVVKTTLDLDLQKAAQEAVASQVKRLAASDVSNGAAVVIDPKTGEILALVGSHDWSDEKNGRINMAIRPRQPGSSFKPLIYAKAFDKKIITSSTRIKDDPVKFGSYEPKNYDNKFRGEVTARYALANSLNIPAVHVLDMLGVDEGVKAAKSLGITTLLDNHEYGLPLVLGAAEVPLIEMTNAYATFANEGTWKSYSILLEVRDRNDTVVLEKSPASRRVFPSGVAYLISSILSDDKARSDAFGGALTISRQAAVKTGTTNDYRDALTIGYTPQVVVGVWIGNNDNKPMNSIAGSLGAAPIWRQIMEAYLKGKPVETFRKPSGVETETICKEDGLKLNEKYSSDSAFLEYYLRGTAPTKFCNIPTLTLTPTQTPTPTITPTPQATDTPTPSPTVLFASPTLIPSLLPTDTTSPSPSPTIILPTL